MQTYIIVGSQQAREAHINQYTLDHSIAPYNITRFNGVIKIADVHDMLKSIRIQVGKNEKRLIIFSGEITIPAQNALLKFLEEPAMSDIVFFSVDSKDYLLDTIISRCQIISLDTAPEPIANTVNFDSILTQEGITKNDIFKIAETVHSSKDYEDCIISMRKWVLQNINGREHNQVAIVVKLLVYLHKQYQLVKENNVNPRFIIESAHTNLGISVRK